MTRTEVPVMLGRVVCAGVLALVMAAPLCAQGTAPSPTGEPSFVSLFTHLPRDAQHLFTAGNGIVFGVGGAAALALHQKDTEIAGHAVTWDGVHSALRAGNRLGNGATQAGFALATYVGGRLTHHAKAAQAGADLVRAQIINALMTDGLKPAVDRTRPNGGRHSFPSGHSSASFATATVLQRRLGWKAGIPAYAMASYVSVSRMTDNKHYASDVVFGATLGVLSGRATTFRKIGGTVQVTPHASPYMAGVIVGWTPDAR